MDFFKTSKVNNFFLSYAKDLIFISISPQKLKADFDIDEVDFMLPIKKIEILNMAKEEYQEIKTSQIIEGILTILGTDYEFRLNPSYVKILNYKIPNIEKIVKSLIAQDIKEKKLYESIIKLRAYLGFINSGDMEARSYYAAGCKEIFANSKNHQNMLEFLEEAKLNFETVIKNNPQNPLAIYELSYIYTGEGQIEKAKKLLEDGIENIKDKGVLEDALELLSSLKIENQLLKAEQLLEENKVNEALKQLYKLSPKNQIQKYRLLFDKGFCYKILGDADMALKCYEEAILINNMDPKLLAELGLIYGYLGEYEQSLEFYFAALNLEPKNIAILCNLTMVLMNIGDFERAREFLDKALEIDDKDDIVIACLKELRKYE